MTSARNCLTTQAMPKPQCLLRRCFFVMNHEGHQGRPRSHAARQTSAVRSAATVFDCQPAARGGSLFRVTRTIANWVRIVAVVFTVGVFYASVCSSTCAVGVCPNQVQHTPSHECEQTPSNHSHHSGHNSPDNPDCSRHEHPGLFLTKSTDLSQFQLSYVGHLTMTAVAVDAALGATAGSTNIVASDLAPPPASPLPLYQQISVLRI